LTKQKFISIEEEGSRSARNGASGVVGPWSRWKYWWMKFEDNRDRRGTGGEPGLGQGLCAGILLRDPPRSSLEPVYLRFAGRWNEEERRI